MALVGYKQLLNDGSMCPICRRATRRGHTRNTILNGKLVRVCRTHHLPEDDEGGAPAVATAPVQIQL